MRELPLSRVGIFPGAFDPVQSGHIAFARMAIAVGGLDKLFFLPEPRPRHKQGVKALSHRVRMIELALEHEERMGVILLQQAESGTLTTLPQLFARLKPAELVLVSGERILRHLPYWLPLEAEHRLGELLIGTYTDKQNLNEQFELLKHTTSLRLSMQTFAAPKLAMTSYKIRRILRQGGETSELPAAVLAYIRQQGLYAPSAA